MEHLQLILNLFNILGINPNLDKLKRQLSIITTWFNHNCIGVLEAVTGFGKTYVAIIAIYRLNLNYPDATTIVIVPTIKLKNDWEEHIRFFGLKNVTVYVVNSYTNRNINYQCTLLVCDEVHNYLSDTGVQFNQTIRITKFDMFLGLSATLEEKEKDELYSMNIPIIDTITMSEALRFNYISNYKVFNFGIDLPSLDAENYARINDIHNSNFSKFYYFVESEKNWELARACAVGNATICKVGTDYKTAQEWRNWYAGVMNWDGIDKEHVWSPTNISKYANQWSWAMRERKDFVQKHEAKIRVAKQIIEYLNVPTITFSENTDFADNLAKALGNKAMVYHSNIESGIELIPTTTTRKNFTSAKRVKLETGGDLKSNPGGGYTITYNKERKISAKALKRIAISKFESGEIQVLVTAKALDEGFDVNNIECAIICSGSSKKRQYIQRQGRSLRFKEGKTAKIFNLYFKNTQDEVWLKKRQKGDPGIIWIDKLEEII